MEMDIEKQVKYINIELKRNPNATVNKLCDKMGVKQSTFKSRVHRAGYKFDFDNRAYVKDDATVIMSKPIEEDDSKTLVITDEVIKNNLIGLANNYDKIMALINGYDNQYDKRYDGIIIELPIETEKDFRTTIRINNAVWTQFNKFVEDHKEFTKKDLLSMALKEYMNKYEKK